MKVVIQKDLFQRSLDPFSAAAENHGIRFLQTDVLDEASMLKHHNNGATCFVIGAETYSSGFFSSLQEGSAIIRYGVGYNAVPIDICKQRNIMVGYTPDTLTDSVAEHTFALLLSVVRRIPELHQSVKNENWKGVSGRELKNKSIAIIGYGQIGRAVAKIAKSGFGMRVFAFDCKEASDSGFCDLYSNNYAELVNQADVVSLHLAAGPSTMGYINKERIDMMKDGTILINTARGELIAEKDLFEALTSGKISAAGLDVFGKEPYEPAPGRDFRKLDNVVLTPHCGSNTIEASNRMAALVIENILAYFSGAGMTLIPELEETFKTRKEYSSEKASDKSPQQL